MSPLQRAHMICYSSSTTTMRHSYTVFEIRRVICQNSPTSSNPTCIWYPLWGVTPFEFQKTRVPWLSCGIVCIILHSAISVEDRLVTDKHTYRHTATAYTALSIARAVKMQTRQCSTYVRNRMRHVQCRPHEFVAK